MREGICSYSGHILPKGTGITFVRSDNRAVLYKSNKVRNFVARKIKPRFIRWTQAARMILKKENVVKEQKIEIPQVIKIVRGFPTIPAHIIAERAENRENKEKKPEKEKSEKIKDLSRGTKVYKSEMKRK
ncbi:60S ribosomal protein L24 [Binucleata daphniae]